MMLRQFNLYNQELPALNNEKTLINTINAHCYNLTFTDQPYQEALLNSGVLIPDGVSIVWAIRLLTGQRLTKIAGADLFEYEMQRLQRCRGKCFFLGSSEFTLSKIKEKAKIDYPDVKVETFSPPYKQIFTEKENADMINAINGFNPDVLFVGMTAPKQEKWAWQNYSQIKAGHICCIGAVFDFYAGNINRAPRWLIKLGFEWFYRLVKEPKKMWRRYLIGNTKFLWYVLKEKITLLQLKSN